MTTHYLFLSAAIFAIGAYGVMARKNLLIILMSIELMLNGANIALMAFARQLGDTNGQVFVLMVMGVAAAEVAIGLAILIALFRNKQSVDTRDFVELKG
ncbi:MAG: NADH-quinone oxidoreductase subunit NuoK [Planctomycetota bacterium]